MAQTDSIPPYVGLGVFNGVVETLAETTIPSGPIDRRVLDKLSGADYGAFMSAARFLGLATDNRTATDKFYKLVQAWKKGQAEYKALLQEMLFEAYDPLLEGVDHTQGTAAQLEKAFKDAGVSQGQMLTKTIRFFVKAVQYTGSIVSPHILKGAARPKNGDSKPRKKKKEDEAGAAVITTSIKPTDTLPTGFERMPIPGIANAFIQYPNTLTEANCDVFDAMMVALRAFAKARAGKAGKPT